MPKTQTKDFAIPSKNWNHKLQQIPIQDIREPGCYVDNRHGCLYRVTPEMLSVGGTVFFGFTSSDSWYVTKIHDDYTLPLDECRILTANASMPVNF